MAYKDQYDLDYTIWRPFNIITPYEEGEDEIGISHVFADFLTKLAVNKENPLEILGDGEQVRCFTWIDDVASAIGNFSFVDKTNCETFNLGNPEPVTMKVLAERIFSKLKSATDFFEKDDKLRFKHLPIYEDDVRVRVPAIDKAKSVLKWEPTVSLDEALDLCISHVVND
tara:strand:- start:25 stop:534 length:510 start_codon:yes stop_codon:yes gene_type:complete